MKEECTKQFRGVGISNKLSETAGVFKEVIEKRLWEKRLKSRLKMPTSGGQASRLKGENVEVQRPGVRMLSSNNRTPRQVEGGDGEGVRLL